MFRASIWVMKEHWVVGAECKKREKSDWERGLDRKGLSLEGILSMWKRGFE